MLKPRSQPGSVHLCCLRWQRLCWLSRGALEYATGEGFGEEKDRKGKREKKKEKEKKKKKKKEEKRERRQSIHAHLNAFASRQVFPHSLQETKLEVGVSDPRSAAGVFSLRRRFVEAGSRRNQG